MMFQNTSENLLHVDAEQDGAWLAEQLKNCWLGYNLFRLWLVARIDLVNRYGADLVDENNDTVRRAFIRGWYSVDED